MVQHGLYMDGFKLVGLIDYGKKGKHYREISEIFKQREIDKAYDKLKKTMGSQKALDDFLEKEKNKTVKVSKRKTTSKTIYTRNTFNIITRNGEIEKMPPKKVNIGSKTEAPAESPEKEIADTEGTWLSKSKNGKAIFVTIPVDDLNKMEIQKYTNKDGEVIEQVQLVTSVESLERVLSAEIKGTKLGYFKTK